MATVTTHLDGDPNTSQAHLALGADPAYADAIFNMGLFLQRLERHDEAAEWWRRYLALDGSSPWATRAKRALKYCEIQLASSAS